MALLMAIFFLPLQVTSQFPGLFSAEQVEQLQAARDDQEIGESAFAVLVEVANHQDQSVNHSESTLVASDHSMILKDPARFRGQQFQLNGTLVMNTDVTRPLGLKPGTRAIEEWVIRSDQGIPFIVYVLHDGNRSSSVGQSVRLNGRFYKRLLIQARSGEMKNYLAFVSPGPTRISRPPGLTAEHAWGIVVLVVFLGAIFLFVFVVTRRARRAREPINARVGHDLADEVDDMRPLPQDPAIALGELKRRAEGKP